MSDRTASAGGVPRVLPTMPPRWVFSFFNPIARLLMAAGVPLGFNGLITVRGRQSGLPRTTPVAIIEVSGRRWVWAPWGDVQWVRNLRAAGRATIRQLHEPSLLPRWTAPSCAPAPRVAVGNQSLRSRLPPIHVAPRRRAAARPRSPARAGRAPTMPTAVTPARKGAGSNVSPADAAPATTTTIDSGYVHGRDGGRSYWMRQWALTRSGSPPDRRVKRLSTSIRSSATWPGIA